MDTFSEAHQLLICSGSHHLFESQNQVHLVDLTNWWHSGQYHVISSDYENSGLITNDWMSKQPNTCVHTLVGRRMNHGQLPSLALPPDQYHNKRTAVKGFRASLDWFRHFTLHLVSYRLCSVKARPDNPNTRLVVACTNMCHYHSLLFATFQVRAAPFQTQSALARSGASSDCGDVKGTKLESFLSVAVLFWIEPLTSHHSFH